MKDNINTVENWLKAQKLIIWRITNEAKETVAKYPITEDENVSSAESMDIFRMIASELPKGIYKISGRPKLNSTAGEVSYNLMIFDNSQINDSSDVLSVVRNIQAELEDYKRKAEIERLEAKYKAEIERLKSRKPARESNLDKILGLLPLLLVNQNSGSFLNNLAGAGVTGAGVTGAGVTGAGVTGAGVTGAETETETETETDLKAVLPYIEIMKNTLKEDFEVVFYRLGTLAQISPDTFLQFAKQLGNVLEVIQQQK